MPSPRSRPPATATCTSMQLLQLLRKAGYAETARFQQPEAPSPTSTGSGWTRLPCMSPLLADLLKAVRDSHDGSLHFYYGPDMKTATWSSSQD